MNNKYASPYDQNTARIATVIRKNRKREGSAVPNVISALICLQLAALFIWRLL